MAYKVAVAMMNLRTEHELSLAFRAGVISPNETDRQTDELTNKGQCLIVLSNPGQL